MVGIGFLASVIGVGVVTAADHLDAPATKADHAADITDFYAWHKDDGKIVVVLNYAGLTEVGQPGLYDSSVVYGVHIDNNGDNTPDENVWIRFGQNSMGEWGVQFTGLPGVAEPVVGAVGETIDAGLGTRAYAGLRDDPFFFDLQGLTDTLMTGTLSFDNTRDTFAMTNVNSIIFEMSTDAAAGGSNTVKLWSSTRK
ncbi:MAG: DUF4331 family protein [Nannocystaceae bacterium]